MSKKVLVVRFSAFGDLVLTTGPLAQLRKQSPSLEIDLLTSEIGEELFLNSVDVDQTIVVPKGSRLTDLVRIYRKLKKYDVVIDWQGNFKSYFLKLFQNASFYRVKKQSRQRRQFVKNKKNREHLKKHVAEKYYSVLEKALDLPPKKLEDLRPLYPKNLLSSNKDLFDMPNSVVIHPYASQNNKEWPHFKELISKLNQQDISVVIIGASKHPMEMSDSKKVLNLTNKTTLREMSAIISSAKSFVSTDSGPLHMGVAVKTPTLALFGPTTKEFGFYPQFEDTWVMENNNLDCRPCHVHGGNTCPLEHHRCMKDISVDQVLNKLTSII